MPWLGIPSGRPDFGATEVYKNFFLVVDFTGTRVTKGRAVATEGELGGSSGSKSCFGNWVLLGKTGHLGLGAVKAAC